MPVSREHNCLFVHVPRTGGTSLEVALGIHREWPEPDFDVLHGRLALGQEEYQLQHLSLTETAQFLSPDWLSGCFSFAICRNPWDRLVSAFCWSGATSGFEEFASWACEVVRTRREVVGRHCHLRPQVELLDGPLSFVGRFETLERDALSIFETVGCAVRTLPRSGSTERRRYEDYYNDETRRLVGKTYEADIDRFEYVF